ncbi:MAG: ABC transporter permease [Candidatus Sumerlaeia bacterium]|nr:ABC transporter permease [Candidatus Sumerlaeia bacterium]
MPASPPDTFAETVISSHPRAQVLQTLRDLWEYRELFWAFLVRNLRVRYKQTALGVIWVVLQPLITGVVFSLIFGLVRGQFVDLGSVLFFMAALVPWTAFQNGVQMAALSLEQNANLVSKVFFPRVVVPASQVLSTMVDFLISFAALWVLLLVSQQLNPLGAPLYLLVLLPLLLALQLLPTLGLGLMLSILNAQYRDIKYVIPFVLQVGLFLTVLIPLNEATTEGLARTLGSTDLASIVVALLELNPMAGVVESYRAVVQGEPLPWFLLAKGAVISTVLMILGWWTFSSREQLLVDVL